MSDGMDPGIEIIDVSGGGDALDAITRAEIDMAITTAKRFPRDIRRFGDEVRSMATIDADTAGSCFYSLRRQGKTIQGPSVRLAEIALSCWGNIRAGARILGPTPDGRFIRAMGICHDLEKNVFIAMETTRRITRSDGSIFGDDMIGVTSNAAAAIGFRNAVLKVIPRALLKGAYIECMKVATGGAKTLIEKRKRAFARLAGLNPLLTEERMLAAVGRPSIEEVTLGDVTHLIGLGTAIHDGAQSIEEAFPEPTAVTAADIIPGNGDPPAAAEPEPAPETAAAAPEAPPEGEKTAPPEPKEEAHPVVLLSPLSPEKLDALLGQAQELAGLDEPALSRFTQGKFGVSLANMPAEHEADVFREIKRRAAAMAKRK